MNDMGQIPLVDLRAQFAGIRDEVLSALDRTLAGMNLFLGENVVEFEREFATYCGVGECVGVGSGTDALILALRACGIGTGDEVITVANTFIATVEAIYLVGATPIFVDIDPQTFNMNPNLLEERISPHTRAIMPVHLYGKLAPMPEIMSIAKRHNLVVIEDACQAHGARLNGQAAGSFGDVGCFSFYFSKNLGAYGEAGAVVTDNPDIARSVLKLRNHGSLEKYQHDVLGVNSRLDEMQAAILRIKLRRLDSWNAKRRALAATYGRMLAGCGVRLPPGVDDADHVYHLYVVRTAARELLRQALREAGVATAIHYPIPIHLQRAWSAHHYPSTSLPETEAAANEILSLPIYPEMTSAQVEYIAESVRVWHEQSALISPKSIPKIPGMSEALSLGAGSE